MSAALIVTNESEAQRLIPWARMLARSDNRPLHIIITQEREGDRDWEEIELRIAEDDPADENVGEGEGEEASPASLDAVESIAPALADAVRRLVGIDDDEEDGDESEKVAEVDTTMHRLRDATPDRALIELLPSLGVRLLILPLDALVRESEKEWKSRLYRLSPCETILLRTAGDSALPKHILVPTAGGNNANATLRRAEQIAAVSGGDVTAVYVQGEAGELTSEIGQTVIERNVRGAVGWRRSGSIKTNVIVGDELMDGIQEALASGAHTYDFVMVGAYRHRTIRKIFFGKLANECFSGEGSPAFAAVRAGLPFGTRFQQFCERQVQRFVPQLDRDSRVRLVERVQTSSNWDFDFIALICLSTCIAALGLVQNQAAVVIGAMLVAPLMTPLAGAGLALVQGNGALIKSSLKSVLFGFLLAYLIGIVVGFVIPVGDKGIPAELLARTSPGMVDLLVALVGGVAAAYAMSRPHLSSALPGVAIAAALVPPIATSGIMLARGEWAFARGSVLLFLTNIVAIVLGTAISLRLVGIRDAHHHGTKQTWTRRFGAFLLAAVIGLGFAISHRAPLTGVAAIEGLGETIRERVEASGATFISATKAGESELAVIVESPEDDLGDLPEWIHDVAVSELKDKDLKVKLEIRPVVKIEKLPDADQLARETLREKIRDELTPLNAKLISASENEQAEFVVVIESPNVDLGDTPGKIHELVVTDLNNHELAMKLEIRHVVEVKPVSPPSAHPLVPQSPDTKPATTASSVEVTDQAKEEEAGLSGNSASDE